MDYLKKREEIMKDELKYLKNKNDEYKAKNSDAERRLERKFYLSLPWFIPFSEAKKTEAECKKRTSDLGTSAFDFSIPDFPTLDFNSDLDISHSVINIPFSAPEFNFSSQEIPSKIKKIVKE